MSVKIKIIPVSKGIEVNIGCAFLWETHYKVCKKWNDLRGQLYRQMGSLGKTE